MSGNMAGLPMREESRIAILRAWREEIAASYESADAWRQSILEGQLQPDEHTQEKLALLADFEHSMGTINGIKPSRPIRPTANPRSSEFLSSWLHQGRWAHGELMAKQILKQQAIQKAIDDERVKRKRERDASMKRLLKPRRLAPAAAAGGPASQPQDTPGAMGRSGSLVLKPKVGWDEERLQRMATAKTVKPAAPHTVTVKKLSSEDVDGFVERHHKLAVEQRENRLIKARERVLKEVTASKGKPLELTSEQLQNFVIRHAVEIPQQSARKIETLRMKTLKDTSSGRRIGDGKVNVDEFAARMDETVKRIARSREALLLKTEKERVALMRRDGRAVLYGDAIDRSAAHLFEGEGAMEDLVTFEDVEVRVPMEATGPSAAARSAAARRTPERERVIPAPTRPALPMVEGGGGVGQPSVSFAVAPGGGGEGDSGSQGPPQGGGGELSGGGGVEGRGAGGSVAASASGVGVSVAPAPAASFFTQVVE